MKCLRPVATGLLLTVWLGGCGPDRPDDIRVQHRTIGTAPDPVSDVGPPLGAYEPVWRTTVDITVTENGGGPNYHVVDGHLLVVTKEAIDAYDARTGKPSWHYREPGRQIEGFTATGGAVVAEFRENGSRVVDEHMLGLDSGTGELLWENTNDWDLTYDGDGSLSRPLDKADAVDGVVPISVDDDDGRVGLDARTGDELWELDAYDYTSGDCAATKGGERAVPPDATVLPMTFLCETQNYENAGLKELLLAVQPATGELLWSRRIDSGEGGSAGVQASGGVVMLEPSAEPAVPELIGPDGRTLFTRKSARCSVECQLYVSDGQALFRYAEANGRMEYGDEDTTDMLASVDLRTGRTSRMPDPGALFAAYVPAGGKLYALQTYLGELRGGTIEALLPAGLAVVDVAEQRIDTAPMPTPSMAVFPSGTPTNEGIVGLGGERLFTVRGSDRPELTAYEVKRTAEPTELGGVSPDDWPDPCQLLADLPRDLYETADRPVEPGPRTRVGDVTLDRVSCARGTTSVRVSWVAKTDEEAEQLFQDGQPSSVGADEERQLSTNVTAYLVGRTILIVDTFTDHPESIERKVIENLRAL